MKKIVVFASGSGSNAENIIKYFNLNAKAVVVCVFTNNANAKVIERAKNLNVETKIFSKENLNEGNILHNLNQIKPDLIVLAGFLLKFPSAIINRYPNKIINIHPALLPKFGGKGMYGMHVHKAVLDNNETETGITIHYVNENYDEGAVIFQKKITIVGNETAEDIANKIHVLEHQFFPEIVAQILTL